MEVGKKLLILGLTCWLGNCQRQCSNGFAKVGRNCEDINECEESLLECGDHSSCFNTNGSYYCQCKTGFRHTGGQTNFTGVDGQCQDINECTNLEHNCSRMAFCTNRIGSYNCTCNTGYMDLNKNKSGRQCQDIDECDQASDGEGICGSTGKCVNTDGSYLCECPKGYTTYGNERTPCSELTCDSFNPGSSTAQSLAGLAEILSMMRNSCQALSDPNISEEGKVYGEALLEKLFTATQAILAPENFGNLNQSEEVSKLLTTVERSILLIGPQLKHNSTKIATTETDAEISVHKGKAPPTGHILLANENAQLDTDWTTAAGTGPYPGFAMAALLSYKNLDRSLNDYFEGLEGHEIDEVQPYFQVSSRVATIVVSNPSTQSLSHPVNITLRHLQEEKETDELRYICAYWNERGAWATDGCDKQTSNASHTVCTCKHLSSFAVLMALYPMEPNYGLLLVTKIGLTISLVCLVLSILTFGLCRSIQGTRTTIHLHLCICLFAADLVFLAGISQTKPEGGCRLVAGLLHFFFLGVFSWMLLEGVQLYRMVVLVFNATIRPLYLYATGYGVPLAIVVLSAAIRPRGYGTKQHCWLSLGDGLIWSFFGPVCLIIILNVFFFIVTVWRLAQKFTSLNPDLSKLHKIRAFMVTAVAQMCILGLMWVFGAFLFQKDAIVLAYIFTILNSLQGALVFVMHCLLSKQVREEYARLLSCVCTPQKKRYSDFSSTNPSSSQSQGSRSGQLTGESQI